MEKLNIDPEFRDKIPAMPKEDFEGLREDITRDGYVRDPLVVWQEENTLLDGHHRWRVICENHWEDCKDKYKLDYKSFPDRWAAIAWICANQLHKHNMTELQRAKLIQEEYEARKKSHGGDRRSEDFSSEEIHHLKNDKMPKLRAEIAKEHNVAESVIQTAVEIGRGIDNAAKVDPEFKREVLSGEIKARKSDLAAIRKLETEEDISAAIAEIRNPTRDKKQSTNPRGWTREDRANRAETEAIIADMLDPSTVPEYTADSLIDEIRLNSEQWVRMLRNMIADRSAVLTSETRPMIAEAITKYVMNEFEKVRDIVNEIS